MAYSNLGQSTIAEYLAFEELAEERHEFHNGVVSVMEPNSYTHSLINVNLIGCLVGELRKTPYAIVGGTMRVRVGLGAHYVYPDATIIREPPEFDADDAKKTTLVSPLVIIETLVPWTEEHDRGRKFELYRETPSLREYVLISSSLPRIETFRADHTGTWTRVADFTALDDAAELATLGLRLPLRDAYRGVNSKSLVRHDRPAETTARARLRGGTSPGHSA